MRAWRVEHLPRRAAANKGILDAMVADSTSSSSPELPTGQPGLSSPPPELSTSTEPSCGAAAAPGTPGTERFKLRFRFRKGLDLRLLSHHDLMRTFERMLRRSGLPFRSSRGFHPKPRLVFALSLPLGVIGCEEVAEVELDREVPLEEVRAQLTHEAPPGITILSVGWVSPRTTAQVRRLTYTLTLPAAVADSPSAPPPPAGPPPALDALRERMRQVLQTDHCWIERARPRRRRADLRSFISDLRLRPACAGAGAATTSPWLLDMELWLTPGGTARPDEVLGLLGLEGLLEAGVLLERSRLELYDEMTSSDAEGIA